MQSRIHKLEVKRFRGATQDTAVEFDTSKSMVMVFGENGTGKSTLVDAIDAVCNGALGSITERSPGAAPWQYVPSIGRDPGEVEVALRTHEGTAWRARLSGRSVKVEGEEPTPHVHVLRRSQLLKLTEAQPAKRYEVVEPFIDVGGVEQAEQSLREAVRQNRQAFATAEALHAQALEALARTYEAEREESEAADVLAWAEARAAEDTTTLNNRHRRFVKLLRDIDLTLRNAEDYRERMQLTERAEITLAEALDELAEVTREDERRDELVAVLEAAEAYIAVPNDVETCPVCEQAVEAAALRERVRLELEELQRVRDVARRIGTARDTLTKRKTAADAGRERLLEAIVPVSQWLSDAPTEGLDRDAVRASLDQEDPARATEAALVVTADLPSVELILRQREGELKERIALHREIAGNLANVKENARLLEDNHLLQERLEAALEVVERRRKAYVQRVLDDIRDEVNRLYECIHPGEEVGLDRLELPENRRASLEQHARFGGHQEVTPQAYYSESHLDTLGFCFWLALAKRSGAEQAILVLDDVFTSVDLDHFQRITEVLDAEANNFQQVIVATHSRR